MKKSPRSTTILPVVLAVIFIMLDLLLDRFFGGSGRLDWAHLVLAVSILLISYSLMNRAGDEARRAEAVLQQSRDELEMSVAERTAELQQANEALRSTQLEADAGRRHLEAVLQALPIGVVVTDADGGVLFTNGMDEQIWGPRPVTHGVEDYAQYPAWWADSGKPIEPHEWASAQAVQRGRPVHGQVLEIQCFDGRRGFILNSAVPIRDGDGRLVGSAVAIQDITELRRVEQELRASQETAQALMNASPESAVLFDSRGHILAANETAAQRLATPLAQLVGTSAFDYFAPEVRQRRLGYLEQVLQARQPFCFVDERDERIYDTHVNPILDAEGNVIRLAVFSQDITARVQTEALLRETIERFEYTQAAAGAGSWDWDLSSGRIEWSPKMFQLFGLDPQTAAASFEAWRSVLHPADLEAAEKRITLALEAHSDLQNEYRVILPDGGIRWITALGRGAYDDQGRPIRMSGICLDITDRKRTEARIQHLSSFPELNPNPVVEVDASGAITFHNPAAARTLERLGLTDDVSIFLPGDMTMILQELDRQSESSFRREVRVGAAIFAETLHVIPSSCVVRIYGFDITERVHAQAAMAASEEKYRMLFQNMAEGFALYELIYDEQGSPVDWRVLEVNDAYERHTGIARSQIAGQRISELFPASIPEYLPRFAAVVANQAPMEFETYAGVVGRHQHVSTFPAGGNRFASIVEDITRRKQSEEALRQAQAELALDVQKRSSLEERQRLARELHDSVSQALYGISLGVHTALTLFDTDRVKTREALDYTLSLAHAGLTEMRALIFELRPESLEKEGLVAALTRHAEALRVRHGIAVDLSLCEEPDVPLSVKEALYRIAQEALQNAVKHAHPERLDVRLSCSPEGLRLEVCDDGAGFDPSEDHPGHLGLHSMRERALNLGGALDIVSDYGCGTQIYVSVPFA